MSNYQLPKKLAAQAMREAADELAAQHRNGVFDDGDPNHPKHNNGINYATGKPATIFGHETNGFMARQHRKS